MKARVNRFDVSPGAAPELSNYMSPNPALKKANIRAKGSKGKGIKAVPSKIPRLTPVQPCPQLQPGSVDESGSIESSNRCSPRRHVRSLALCKISTTRERQF